MEVPFRNRKSQSRGRSEFDYWRTTRKKRREP